MSEQNAGSDVASMFFEDCEVPEVNALGGIGNGEKVLMSGGQEEVLHYGVRGHSIVEA
ncbi:MULTISPECIES: hypothetical protein [Cupriavidus]|uniref:hypothetical protein n=1 Tax=Cupriavidus sp. DF5525 TaxID=3160989 RepID=UPI00041A6088